jgi:hypothetical protein
LVRVELLRPTGLKAFAPGIVLATLDEQKRSLCRASHHMRRKVVSDDSSK